MVVIANCIYILIKLLLMLFWRTAVMTYLKLLIQFLYCVGKSKSIIVIAILFTIIY
jgi:hypothetical protein